MVGAGIFKVFSSLSSKENSDKDFYSSITGSMTGVTSIDRGSSYSFSSGDRSSFIMGECLGDGMAYH